ncbi:putative kinesin [Lasiosphaeria hispida]|uniref:Kinesin n=1 Tax=Lasiosphaeria hispida TaxID=260671 RepID=A0AAJ0HCW3_9PEZI|nr:putative kinesin [Lasiosphaeria hispida]
MTESDSESDLVGLVSACLFLGVPNDGMDIESLIPMVGDQPNRPLLESLAVMNSQILTLQSKSFSRILGQAQFNMFCFYETKLSPTAAKDPITGQYKMVGSSRRLVTRSSATSCLPKGGSSDHAVAINRTHSDLVKFASHDSDYDGVSHVLSKIHHRCEYISGRPNGMGIGTTNGDGKDSSHEGLNGRDGGCGHEPFTPFLVPYTSNLKFIGRSAILEQLRSQLRHGPHLTDGTPQPRVSIHGLGGIGKTQIALAYIYWLRQTHPQVSVFWVHTSSAERFRQAYTSIAQECQVPGYGDPKSDVLHLVKTWLQSKDRGRWLMVIDNADDAHLFSQPGNLAQWIPECEHGSVLVTTRNKVAGSRLTRGGCLIEVMKMDKGESKQLLQEKLKADDLDMDDLSRLASRLEHLPLALVQATAFIQEMSITVGKYLQLLEKSDQHFVDLLTEEFETVGRDSETLHAVVETWILSFEQIQQQDILASELLSLMSLFDRQAIPQKFLSDYIERQQKQELRGEMELVKALGVLKAFSFITEDKGNCFDMHRLVQLVTRRWLGKKDTMHRFTEQALVVVSQNYPHGNHENRAICSLYLPHVYAMLRFKGTGSRVERLARVSLLFCAAAFFNYQGQWKEAERFLIQATGMQKELLGEEHPGTLASMADLASTYWNQGRWKEAEELLVEVMEARKRVLGEEHPDTLTSMANLAVTYRDQGRWKEAEELEVRVMEARKRVLGEEHPSILTSMANLASTYRDQGRWKEAEELEVRVMEARKRVLVEEHPDTLTSMANLASTYADQGRWKEAEELLVEVMEARKRVLGEEHPSILTSMANLASTYADQGRWKEAEELEVRVMEARKRVLGEEHPDTLTSMANLASTYADQGRWKEAEELEVRVMEARKRVLGEEHPSILTSMANLASTYWDQGRWKEAEELEVQVMEARKRVLGEEHPDTLTSMANLASTYRDQGRWKEAEELEVRVMEARKRVLGEEHPSILTSMANLASTYWDQGRWKEAEELEVRVMEARKRVLGEEHPDTLTSMANLAVTYRDQGRWKEAEELEVRVMEARKRVLGEEHPSILTSMANLASTYRDQGRWKEAEELEVEVMEARKRVLGEEHPDTLTSMANLAVTYQDQGRWKEAEELEVQVMEARKRVLGEEHPSTLTSMANLASTYAGQGRWKEAEELQAKELGICSRVLGEEHPSTLTSMTNLALAWRSQGRLSEALTLMRRCVELQQQLLGPDHPNTVSIFSTLRR